MSRIPFLRIGAAVGVLACLSLPVAANAQQVPVPATSEKTTSAVISGPSDVGVGKTVVLDASASHTTGERVEYKWTIDETKQTIARTVQAIYTPEKSGVLTFRLNIRSTGLDGKAETSEVTHVVTVFKRKIVVVADGSVPPEKLQTHAETALAEGVLLRVVQPDPSTPTLSVEDSIFSMLSERKDVLSNAEAVVVWTEGIAGLQGLMRSVRADPDRTAQMRNLSIILITERSLSTLERTVRGAFSLLSPQEIIMTRKEAINPLIQAIDIAQFHEFLASRDIDSVALTSDSLGLRPWNVISMLVNYLLAHGVSSHTVILLLMLPVIATIFTFLKQVVGVTSFGLYTPSIIALSFLSLGWVTGTLFLLFILVTGYLTRSLMSRWRMLYIPKVAIILTVLSFSLLVLVAMGTWFGLTFNRDTVFMLLILSTLAENFLSLKSEEGWWSAVLGITETVVGALLCVIVVQWPLLQSLVLAYPELILLTLIANAFLGRWTGLRLIEYFRFREVFKHLQEEE